MDFEGFKTIHQLIKATIKDTEFDGQSYYVGGCVRDAILNRPIKDIDISVQIPNGGIRLAEFLCKKLDIYKEGSNPIVFPQFGTAKFNLKGIFSQLGDVEIETVQTRKEAYRDKDSRKPETCFGSVQEDANRRDLTINAIYLNITNGTMFDMTGKSDNDIRKHILRTPIDAKESFEDDALRILRVIRFASTLGWGIEPKTWAGMCIKAYRLKTISKERINDEFNKIITSEHAADGIRRLYLCGALKYIIPELIELKNLEQGSRHGEDAFDHSLTVMSKMQPTVESRLAGLLHDIGKPSTRSRSFTGRISFINHETVGAKLTEKILTDLKYPKNTIKRVQNAVANHMRFKQTTLPTNKALRKFANEIGNEDDLNLTLELIEADNTSHALKFCKIGQVDKIKKRLEAIIEQSDLDDLKLKLPINGKDIMKAFNLKKGPKIGNALRLLTEYMYISPKMTKDEALKIVQRAIEKGDI